MSDFIVGKSTEALIKTNDEVLNFSKFATSVRSEYAKALRHIFVFMWDTRIAPLHGDFFWDDSNGVRLLLFTIVGKKTKIPTNISFQEWDCTIFFEAILYADIFALPDSKGNMKTLGDLYIRNRKPLPGQFHSSVASPSGDPNETIALAIDQLRLLRNTECHLPSASVDNANFDDYYKRAKEAFTVLKYSTQGLDDIAQKYYYEKGEGLHDTILEGLEMTTGMEEDQTDEMIVAVQKAEDKCANTVRCWEWQKYINMVFILMILGVIACIIYTHCDMKFSINSEVDLACTFSLVPWRAAVN